MTAAILLPAQIGLTWGFILCNYISRQQLASAGFALFLVSSLLVRNFGDMWQAIGWIGLYGGFFLSPRKRYGWPFKLGLLLLVFHLLAIPGNLIWGDRVWHSTAAVVLWMAPSILLLIGGTRQTLAWLTPAWLIHAGIIVYQAFTRWHIDSDSGIMVREGAVSGLSHNTNLAAGFLVLGIVYLLTLDNRWKWLAVPLILALVLTGSRWGGLVGGAAVLALVFSGRLDWRPPVAAIAGIFLLIFALWLTLPDWSYGVSGFDSLVAFVDPVRNGEVTQRLGVPHIPSILPRGVAQHPGLHNVPLRIAYENGILAASLWLGVTGKALWPHRRQEHCAKEGARRGNAPLILETAPTGLTRRFNGFTASWWLLLALVMLSMLDYFMWMGHLGGFWWLLIGLRLNDDGNGRSIGGSAGGGGKYRSNDLHYDALISDSKMDSQPEIPVGPGEWDDVPKFLAREFGK